jgi:glycine/D-amino acid oxidase-like deaminating enzyme/nitrite reductase/ring-hydroxylating ferredoxin subunit
VAEGPLTVAGSMGYTKKESYWLKTATLPETDRGAVPDHVDVAIVGAGIVGLCTAYELVRRGRKPVVFERGRMASAVSGHTTAKVTSQHGIRYRKLIETHGRDKARAYGLANQAAIDWLFATCALNEIECGLERDVATVYTHLAENVETLTGEEDACFELGLPVGEPPAGSIPFEVAGATTFVGQARFHPVQFLSGIAKAVMDGGGMIHEHCTVSAIEEGSLTVNEKQVEAAEIVVATHYPVFDSGFFIAKLAPYRSYAMAVETQAVPPCGMFISDEDELHSWRPHGEVMIVGAGCHKVGQEPDTENEYRKLEDWARENFEVRNVLARWSAQDNATHDDLPYVGNSPGQDHIYVATGFDGWGMSNGIASARLIAEIMSGQHDQLAEALDPGRMSLKGAGKLAGENANAVGHLAGDRFVRVEGGVPEDLLVGEAGVFEGDGLSRIAAFRDDDGVLHKLNATCPHFGCQVSWNPAEHTWDCPCHGSRFSYDGEAIQSPAVGGLKKLAATAPSKKGLIL